MARGRNLTVHPYHEDLANQIYSRLPGYAEMMERRLAALAAGLPDASPCRSFLQTFYKSTITLPAFPRSIEAVAAKEVFFVGPLSIDTKSAPPYRDEHLVLDFAQQTAAVDTHRLVLTRKEYDLLALLVQHAGEIIPRNALLYRVWGYSPEIRTRTLDVHIRRLRKKLGAYADQYIETIFGIGYRFQPFHAARYFNTGAVKQPLALGA